MQDNLKASRAKFETLSWPALLHRDKNAWLAYSHSSPGLTSAQNQPWVCPVKLYWQSFLEKNILRTANNNPNL